MNRKWRWRGKAAVIVFVLVILLEYYGAFRRLAEQDFDRHFVYPLDVDMQHILSDVRAGKQVDIAPISRAKISYVADPEAVCQTGGEIFLLFLVKSALENRARREVIRRMWGSAASRFYPELPVKTLFLLGSNGGGGRVRDEVEKHGDIIQGNFRDSYFNNTLKTTMAMAWAVLRCSNARYIMFVDDDFYVAPWNVIRYLISVQPSSNMTTRQPSLYVGYMFNSRPMRHRPSKFFVTLDEYPFSRYPPFIAAGAFIMSFSTIFDMHHTARYTKCFRMDDVFLGLVAKKAGITPQHNDRFYFWKKFYTPSGYRNVLAVHGFEPDELERVYVEQERMEREGKGGGEEWVAKWLEQFLWLKEQIWTLFS